MPRPRVDPAAASSGRRSSVRFAGDVSVRPVRIECRRRRRRLPQGGRRPWRRRRSWWRREQHARRPRRRPCRRGTPLRPGISGFLLPDRSEGAAVRRRWCTCGATSSIARRWRLLRLRVAGRRAPSCPSCLSASLAAGAALRVRTPHDGRRRRAGTIGVPSGVDRTTRWRKGRAATEPPPADLGGLGAIVPHRGRSSRRPPSARWRWRPRATAVRLFVSSSTRRSWRRATRPSAPTKSLGGAGI